jgi:hypothetical protein
MKKAVFLGLFFVLTANIFAQQPAAGFDMSNYGVRIEPDKRVMVVLATIEAARTTDAAGEPKPVINTKLSEQGQRFREQLKSDLAALNPDLRQRISLFVDQYKKRNPNKSDAELVAPFISMAYALTPVPELADPVVTTDLPAGLLDVLDFAPLVRDFYRRSSFSGNLNEYVKTYQAASDTQLRSSAREMVSDLLGYLHTRPQIYYSERIKTETQKSGSKSTTLKNVEVRERERRFFIVPEMLAPADAVNFLNVKDDYFVVVPPDADLTFSEARRGFLQFVIDPIVLNNAKDIATIRDNVKKLLDEKRKVDSNVSPDVYLTISRSLVAAIDAKQGENLRVQIATAQSRRKIAEMGSDPEKKIYGELEKFKKEQAEETILRLSEDYDRGAVLDFYFADQLKGIEDSQFDIAASFREMLLSFDPAKETNRYAQYEEARSRARAAREARRKNPTTMVVENKVTTTLVEVQKKIDAKNYAGAASDLKLLVEKNPGEARIYYNLGRIASLSAESLTDSAQQKAKLLEAKSNYENVIKIAQKQREDAAKGIAVSQPVEAALISLSYVALAKIYEFYDEKSYAAALYDAAIKIGPDAGNVYQEAITAKQRLVKEQ